MIKNIVFDMGNVLVHYQPAEFIQLFVSDPDQQKLLLEKIFHSVRWIQYDRGVITNEEIITQVCQEVPESLHPVVTELVMNWYKEIKPLPEMGSVLRALKDQNYQLYILSNAPTDFYQFKDIVPEIECIDGCFVSSDWKVIKLEAEIYTAFCQHFRLLPSECYFIDDLPNNVEAALNRGMDGFVYRGDVEALIKDLERVAVYLT